MRLLHQGERDFEAYLLELENRVTEEGLRLDRKVRSILTDVRQRGDRALLHYTQAFDGVDILAHKLKVRESEVKRAYRKIPSDFVRTLQKAAFRIRKFHQSQHQNGIQGSFPRGGREKGIRLGQLIRPLERVGIYVPGGKASYPSTVLMAAIPAKVAGVQEVIMTTPPQQEGINPAVLVAADLAGVDEIYRVGGVQAIGALAYGTDLIRKVDKIVGPGNRYVVAAKRLVFGVVDIDMVAGPSEILIIADGKTPASFVAADLISQAEHDEKAMAILITISEAFGKMVRDEVDRQLAVLKRKKIAERSLRQRGAILVVKGLNDAVALANRIAPEHLELSLSRAEALLKNVKHAGAVFLGPYTPEAIGDYLAGPNHILPTGGTARFASPLGAEDFIKRINFMSFTPSALGSFEKDLKRFTEWEGLEGHYLAVQKRVGNKR